MDPNFVEVQTKFSADLHPSTLRNVTGSFQSILDDLLLTYRERLGGIVLGYHDERIVNKTASVHAFFPYFHVDAEATLSVMRLEKDKHLVGRINKLAPDYIGMLVLGAFNAVVHKDQLRGKFKFEKQGGVWVQRSDKTCRLKAGSMVKFAIQRVDASSSRFLIIGTMLPDSCSAYQPPAGAPQPVPTNLGLSIAAASVHASGSAAALGVRMQPGTASPAAASLGPHAAAETSPRRDDARAHKKKKSKQQARDRDREEEAEEAEDVAAELSGDSDAGVDAAALSDEDAADASAGPATDAAAADDGEVVVDGRGEAAADGEEEAAEVPEEPKKRKKKKKRDRNGAEDGGVAGDGAEAATDEHGAQRNGAVAPSGDAAAAAHEASAGAAAKKRRSKQAEGVGGEAEADGVAERKAARKEKKRRRAEGVRHREGEAAAGDAQGGAVGTSGVVDDAGRDDRPESHGVDEEGEDIAAVEPAKAVGKKKKVQNRGAGDKAGSPENGAAVKKKARKSRKARGS